VPPAPHQLASRTISDFARSQLMALVDEEHWSKLHVVHCGVDIEDFVAPERTGRDGSPRVLFVGRLVHLKGPMLLVEAVADLKRRGLVVEATLVGEGPKRSSLEALIEALEGRSGLLVPAGRRDELADALEALARDPERRSVMGRAGRAKVASEFELHRSAEQLREIYAGALASNGSVS